MDYIVGDEPCTFLEVTRVLLNSPTSGLLVSRLVDLANSLPTHVDVRNRLRANLLILSTSDEVLHGILTSWRAQASNNATLRVLISHLESLQLISSADDLRRHFRLPPDSVKKE